MIKIARDAAERLLLMCLYFKAREYNCLGTLEDSLGRKHPFKSNVVLRNLYNEGLAQGGPWTQWQEFCTHLQDQLVGSPSTAHYPTLIDIVVDLLQAPYARNVMSGRNLQQLRRAILLPEEMIKFGESVRKEMGCAGCGKTFVNGEMTSFRTDGDETAFYCTRCTTPTLGACRVNSGSPCEGAGEIDNKHLTKILQRTDCGSHTPAKDKPKEPTVAEMLEANRIRQELAQLAPDVPNPPDQVVQWAEVGQPPAPAAPGDPMQVRINPVAPHPWGAARAQVPPGFRAVRGRDGRVELRRDRPDDVGGGNPFIIREGGE